MALSDEERQALKEKYGDKTVVVENEHGTFVFSKPGKAAWSRCLNKLASDDRKLDRVSTMDQLARDCLVYPEVNGQPDRGKLTVMLEEYGALSQTLFGELGDLIGAGPSHAGKL